MDDTRIRSWVLLAVHGAALIFGGLYWLLRGHAFDHALYEAIVGPSWQTIVALAPPLERLIEALVRIGGTLAITAGILVVAMAATSFRRGARWTWYAAWALPIQAALDLAVLLGYGAARPISVLWDALLITLSLTALVTSATPMFERAAEPTSA